jgi:hypothetical protein
VAAQKAKVPTEEQKCILEDWAAVVGNQVGNQTAEWLAFNAAWALDKKAAMLATSWGTGQIMGFNHTALGFATVDAMIDDFKKGEYQQTRGIVLFIRRKPALHSAVLAKDWRKFAYNYNGPKYALGKYDQKIAEAIVYYTKNPQAI